VRESGLMDISKNIKNHKQMKFEMEKRIKELSTLKKIGVIIASTIKLDELWKLLYKQLCRLIEVPSFYITIYDQEKEELYDVINMLNGQPRSNAKKRRRPGNGWIEYIIRTNKPLLIPRDAKIECRKPGTVSGDDKVKSYVGVPIANGTNVIGVMAVQNYKHENAFDEHTVEILSSIADQAAIAIENARLYEETQRLATTDHLTKVWNRRYFDDYLQDELTRAQRLGRRLSVLMIDIDNFKSFNDTYSYSSGDEIICIVARAILVSCRKVDVVGRYGGDEFAVVLLETTSSNAVNISKRF